MSNINDTKGNSFNLVKSKLAKLLATENITVVHDSSMKTAAFDLKSRVVMLPVWKQMSEDLYDLLVVHEVGHALETNMDVWLKGVRDICREFSLDANYEAFFIKDVMNVVEDARIDRLQKIRYPGSKKNYYYGSKELLARDFYGLKGRSPSELNFIDRMNIYYKTNDEFSISFDKEEQVFVDRAAKTQTMEDVVKLTRDIFEFLKERDEVRQSSVTTQKNIAIVVPADEDGNGDGEEVDLSQFDEVHIDKEAFEKAKNNKKGQSGKGKGKNQGIDLPSSSTGGSDQEEDKDHSQDKSDSGNGKKDTDKGKDQSKSENNKDSGKDNENKEASSSKASSTQNPIGGRGVAGSPDNNRPTKIFVYEFESQTQKAAEQAMKEMIDVTASVGNGEIPNMDIRKIVDDYKVFIEQHKKNSPWYQNRHAHDFEKVKIDLNRYLESQKAVIAHMVSEFERHKAADTHIRARESKTGVLDMNRLHTYKFNDDLFKKATILPEGKNHGFIIVLDWSGSMGGFAMDTMKQLFVFAIFCKKIGVPYEIFLFRDPMPGESKHGMFTDRGRMSYSLDFGGLKLRNVLSSRMTNLEMREAMANLWCISNTPRSMPTSMIDQMTGTPLQQTALALSEVVKNFQERNKLQVTNCIIMTDGAPNPHYYRSKSGKSTAAKVVVSDPMTRKTYLVETRDSYAKGNRSDNMLSCMLNVLKDRTGCNLLGYYICNNIPFPVTKQQTTDFVKSGFTSASLFGFDEYYFINVSSLSSGSSDSPTNTGNLNRDFVAKKTRMNDRKKFIKNLIMRCSKESKK